MNCLKGKEAELGPSSPGSIMYNCMPKEELVNFLTNQGLYHEASQKGAGVILGAGVRVRLPSGTCSIALASHTDSVV